MPRKIEDEGGKIKPAGYKQEYEPWQIAEIIKCTNDFVYFVKTYVYIQHPTQGAVLCTLRDYQEDLLNVYDNNRLVITMLCRQSGKTMTAAVFLLWWAIFKNDQRILVASKDQEGANDIIERLWYAYEELPWWIKPGVKTDQIKTKAFDNGSSVHGSATTATSGRGKSNSLIYLDEFAFVAPNIAEAFWTSLWPTISTGGKCIITSTPNSDEDKFAQIWFNSKLHITSDKWEDIYTIRAKDNQELENYEILYETENIKSETQFIEEAIQDTTEEESIQGFIGFHTRWTRVPDEVNGGFRGEKFKKSTLLSGITETAWASEFLCSFVIGDSTLISATVLASLKMGVRKPRFINQWGVRWYEEIKPNTVYSVILDPSEGVGLDDACIQVWEIPNMIQVAEWNDNMSDQVEQTKMLRRILSAIDIMQQGDSEHVGVSTIYYSVERNGLGIGILNTIELFGEERFPGFLIDSSMTSVNIRGNGRESSNVNRWRGLLTNASNKKRYCIELKSLIERQLFVPRSKHMLSQLKTFVKMGNSWAAKTGMKDDIVMSNVLMCMIIDEIRTHEPELDDLITIDLDEYDPDDASHDLNQPMLPIL